MRTLRRRSPPLPTEAELGILNALWNLGPCTVRQVHEALLRNRPTGYTTTLKVMQRMVDKGLVLRDESERPHVYRPRLTKEETQSRLVGRLMQGAFGGFARDLVLQALRAKDVSADEIARIEKLLDGIEGE